MKYVRSSVLLVAISSLSTPAVAAASSPACGASAKTALYYGNGMFTELADARASAVALRKAMVTNATDKALESDPSKLAYCIAYNFNEPLMTQLAQVLTQKTMDSAIVVQEDLLKTGRSLTQAYFGWLLPDQVITEASDDVAQILSDARAKADQDLARHLAAYHADIRGGARVLVVSHSQGGFYSNQAFAGLNTSEHKSFGQVMVATPTERVLTDGPYTTARNDLVVKGVQLLFPSTTLASNFAAIDPQHDPWGHAFDLAYLFDAASRKKILDDIAAVGATLAYPAGSSDADLKISVSGAAPGHFNLHVFEPGNDFHVFYKEPQGQYGVLFTDAGARRDTDEYVTNATFATGMSLAIGVNFESTQEGPGDAVVTMSSANWQQTTTVHFDEPNPIIGILTPVRAGTIAVSAAEDGSKKYTFTPVGS